jgi:hypothetical protein
MRLLDAGTRMTARHPGGHPDGVGGADPLNRHAPPVRGPTAADYRREADVLDRWRTVAAMAFVSALAALLFWLLPPPPVPGPLHPSPSHETSAKSR